MIASTDEVHAKRRIQTIKLINNEFTASLEPFPINDFLLFLDTLSRSFAILVAIRRLVMLNLIQHLFTPLNPEQVQGNAAHGTKGSFRDK
ncbi:MAG TPA: hypothetical protein PLU88_11285 [Armatimonadota bacterium]|nr:hypothetical protein [Armatimonadota bacterium]